MKLFDAINASSVEAAFRYLSPSDPDGNLVPNEVNIVLVDGKSDVPKAFLAMDNVAWVRKKLRVAKQYDDWLPAKSRNAPVLIPPDPVTRLGDVL